MWNKEESIREYRIRECERVSLALRIQITGKNFFGDTSQCDGRTEEVSQHGATIRLAQKLAPGQQVVVRCTDTGEQAAARVVARVYQTSGGKPNGKLKEFSYGVAFLNSQAPPWGIAFPPRGDAAGAIGRIVLECMACHHRELAYLDGFELEVLESNETVSRYCRRCLDTSVWMKSFDSLPAAGSGGETDPSNENRRGPERRHHARHNARVIACIRRITLAEELVKVRNVSRIGLCFESRHEYEESAEIQIAVPYASGGGNVFVPGQIVRLEPVIQKGLTLYGVEYRR